MRTFEDPHVFKIAVPWFRQSGAIPESQPARPPIDRSAKTNIRENFGSRTSPPPAHPFLQIRINEQSGS
ncbi:MAG: hypothetical protein K1X67_05850 [Fimbriimonadaceae bacterium]|nr:hypothetical protein [Fimbriimonadaceae bacterium]